MAQCLDESADRKSCSLGAGDAASHVSFGRKIDLDVSTLICNTATALPWHCFSIFRVSWLGRLQRHHQFAAQAVQFMQRFRNEIWLRFQQFKVPAIRRPRTRHAKPCAKSSKVNTGGVADGVSKLMTATFAADEFNLRDDDWDARQERLTAKHDVLTAVDGTSFLTAVTLLASYRRHKAQGIRQLQACRRAELPLADFKALESDLEKASSGLPSCWRKNLRRPKPAVCHATHSVVGHLRSLADRTTQHGVKQKLLRWYWSGVLGELYGGASKKPVSAWTSGCGRLGRRRQQDAHGARRQLPPPTPAVLPKPPRCRL